MKKKLIHTYWVDGTYKIYHIEFIHSTQPIDHINVEITSNIQDGKTFYKYEFKKPDSGKE